MNYGAMAQRWHDTDHGRDRGAPLKHSRFIRPVKDTDPGYVSACWCCCEYCDPGWAQNGRPNPFWERASRSAGNVGGRPRSRG